MVFTAINVKSTKKTLSWPSVDEVKNVEAKCNDDPRTNGLLGAKISWLEVVVLLEEKKEETRE
ncbi:hypothetical protein V1477_000268 [Vespula maculifrons]